MDNDQYDKDIYILHFVLSITFNEIIKYLPISKPVF